MPTFQTFQVTLVSTLSDGSQSTQDATTPTISGDGRYVAFQSNSRDLLARDPNNRAHLFLKDLQTGQLIRIDQVATGDPEDSGGSSHAILSADGTRVVFDSYDNLITNPGVQQPNNIYISPTVSPFATLITQVGGVPGTNADIGDVSADGRYVVFTVQDGANNLLAGPGGANTLQDVVLADTTTGALTLISYDNSAGNASVGIPPNDHFAGSSFRPSISADGGYVAFTSGIQNTAAPADPAFGNDVFVRNLSDFSVQRVSTSSTGVMGNGDSFSDDISQGGRYVLFESDATNLVAGDTNGKRDVFVKDTVTNITTRVSTSSTGLQGNDDSHGVSISADGRFTLLESGASNLVAGDTNGGLDYFVKDNFTGQIALVSKSQSGTQVAGGSLFSYSGNMSDDGRYIVFETTTSLDAADNVSSDFDVYRVTNPLFFTNNIPVVNAPAVKNTDQLVWNQFSTFMSASDQDGDPIVGYEVRDNTATAGSGILYANGAVQAQGVTVSVSGSSLAGVYVQGGANLGQDSIDVRAFDGFDWSNWTNFTLNTRAPNRAPVVTPTLVGTTVGTPIALSSLIDVTDADGDTMTQYLIYDAGSGGGYFTVNGLTVAPMTAKPVLAQDLATTFYVGGSVSGSETLYVQAYDGTAWSAVTGWTENTLRQTDVAPTINTQAVVNTTQGTWNQFSTFMSASDQEGDPLVFQVRDNTATAGSGILYANGVVQAQGATATVSGAAGLTGIYVQGGANLGQDSIDIRANDGYGWTGWTNFTLNTRLPNRAPVVTSTLVGTTVNTQVALGSLFNVTDADGDAMVKYEIYDAGPGGGHFVVNTNVVVAAQTVTPVLAQDLATAFYQGGTTAGSETIYVRAYDGTAWSDWGTGWTENTLRQTDVAPTINTQAVVNTTQGTWNQFSTFMSASDQEGDPLVFQVRDNTATAGSGILYANGVVQAQGATATVSGAAGLTGIYVQGGANLGQDSIDIRANDGYGWTGWTNFTLNTRLPNRAPVVTSTLVGTTVNTQVALGSLFNVTDADGDAMVKYEIYDAGPGGGHFVVNTNVVVAAQTVTPVLAQDLATAFYQGGTTAGSETIYVRAYDGTAWSDWGTGWTENTLRQTDVAPTINTQAVVNTTQGTWNQFSTFMSASDQEGDPLVFQVRDNTATAGSGILYANGVVQAQGATATVSGAAGLTGIYVQGGANLGQDSIDIRANDGYGWTGWTNFTLNTRLPNRAPVVTSTLVGTTVNTQVALGSLFNVTDADGDAMVKYEIYDAGPGGGHFVVNTNVVVAAQTVTPVLAQDLATAFYQGGTTAGSETIYVRAYDGTAWSDWGTGWTENTLRQTDVAPTINTQAVVNTTQGTWNQFSTFMSASDQEGDPLVFQVRDNTATAGSGILYANGVVQAQGATATVSGAAGLTGIYVQGGANLGQDSIDIRANDGYGWTGWTNFTLNTRLPNRAPVVTSTLVGTTVNTQVALGSLFNVTDADGDAMVKYEIYDAGPGGGHFVVNTNVVVAAQTVTPVLAQDLATAFYQGGTTAGSETIYVRAYDGTAWSDWGTGWTENTLRQTDVAPTINTQAVVNTTQGTWNQFSTFMSASDQEGDPLVFQVRDNTATAGSGILYANGVVQAQGATATVSGAAGLTGIYVQGGANLGQDSIDIRANDGYGWTGWTNFTLNTRLPNRAPVVTTADNAVGVNAQVSVSSLFNVSDADGDPMVKYQIYDAGTGGGHFVVNGNIVAAQTITQVTAANFANTYYVGGTVPGIETLYVQAYDGTAWSAAQSLNMASIVLSPIVPATTADDTINIFTENNVDYGLQGNDTFNMQNGSGDIEMGGTGNDTYNVADGAVALVYENGNDTADSLSMHFNLSASNVAGTNYAVGTFNNQDLILISGLQFGTPSIAFIFNWQTAGDQIETFHFNDGNYTASQIAARLNDGVHGLNITNAQIQQYQPGVDPSTLHSTMNYYAGIEASLEALVDNAGNTFAAANQISLSTSPQVFQDWVGAADPVDYYHFTLPSAQTVHMQISGLNPNYQVAVSLLNDVNGANGGFADPVNPTSNVTGTSGLTRDFTLNGAALAAGDYQLQIVSTQGNNSPYTLSLSAS